MPLIIFSPKTLLYLHLNSIIYILSKLLSRCWSSLVIKSTDRTVIYRFTRSTDIKSVDDNFSINSIFRLFQIKVFDSMYYTLLIFLLLFGLFDVLLQTLLIFITFFHFFITFLIKIVIHNFRH